MKRNYQAYRMSQPSRAGALETLNWDELGTGEVIIESQYSSVNYKDALAITNRGKILRRLPMVPGIDVAGTVVSCKGGALQAGDQVLVTGCGIGENQDGGYAEFISVPESSVVPLPKGLSLQEAMILGTAGFTAALALYRLEQNGQTPQKGPIVITGASGGVGSIATDLLSAQGYEVWAISSKPESQNFLSELGARKIMAPAQLELGSRPLESVRFAGAIDNVGGSMLSGLLRHVELWGNVASVGLAAGAEFEGNVMPFILRGVSLLGISSNNCVLALRHELWRRLAGLWKPKHLAQIHSRTISLHELPKVCEEILDRKSTGRILVDLKKGLKS
ncbi:MAG: YhdH/YhfP family quinone oxidoreductase [Bdellovibrionales bacterium]